MSVYLVLYHDDIDEQNLFDKMAQEEEFSEFSREIGKSVVDSGSRILTCKEIDTCGQIAKARKHVSRYQMIEAKNIEEAVELSRGAPILRRGGRAEVLELSMNSY